MRTAAASPSTPKGTPLSRGTDCRTKVMPGCTDPTLAPFSRRGESTSLPSAPLEWKTVLPRQAWLSASCAATLAIASSGTVIHTRLESSGVAPSATTCAFTLRASFEVPGENFLPKRTTRNLIPYHARERLRARAEPRFPGPTMLTVGRSVGAFGIAVSITNAPPPSPHRPPALLYSGQHDRPQETHNSIAPASLRNLCFTVTTAGLVVENGIQGPSLRGHSRPGA